MNATLRRFLVGEGGNREGEAGIIFVGQLQPQRFNSQPELVWVPIEWLLAQNTPFPARKHPTLEEVALEVDPLLISK